MVGKKEKSKELTWWWWWWCLLVALFLPAARTWALPTGLIGGSCLQRPLEYIGRGQLPGPEDLAYDATVCACTLFTGCIDGWIKKVSICGEPTVQNWTYVGGESIVPASGSKPVLNVTSRPLGLTFGPNGMLYSTHSTKGLLRISMEGEIKVFAEEAEGLKFGLPNGIAVASNGMVYFTDATQNQTVQHLDGRLLRYDPSSNLTTVLLYGLGFPNGVAVSPTQDFIVYCESYFSSCSKYYIAGEKEGSMENFIDNLPGYPDNIRYDGEEAFWIALPNSKGAVPQEDGGFVAVDVDGNRLVYCAGHDLLLTTTAIKIGNLIYFGSYTNSTISRLDLAPFLP